MAKHRPYNGKVDVWSAGMVAARFLLGLPHMSRVWEDLCEEEQAEDAVNRLRRRSKAYRRRAASLAVESRVCEAAASASSLAFGPGGAGCSESNCVGFSGVGEAGVGPVTMSPKTSDLCAQLAGEFRLAADLVAQMVQPHEAPEARSSAGVLLMHEFLLRRAGAAVDQCPVEVVA